MKTTVNKYDPCGESTETTEVNAGDRVMMYNDAGYETFATVIEAITSGKTVQLIVQFEDDDEGCDKDHVAIDAMEFYSENTNV